MTPPSCLRTRALTSLACAAACATLVACGGAAREPKSPAEEAAPEPTTIEEAQAQIARAKAELEGGAASGQAVNDRELVESAPAAESTTAEPDEPEPSASRPGSACASPCRALASMRRAVGALCRMTGDADPRCSDARATLATSESRVAGCHC